MNHSRTIRRAAAGVLAAAVVLPAGALATSGHATRAKSVTVKDFEFTPATVRIKKGQSVTWRFKDSTAHTVKGRGFKSRAIRAGSFSHRFTKKGTYRYICTIHPSMKAKVVVS
jgi:plastocyanin